MKNTLNKFLLIIILLINYISYGQTFLPVISANTTYVNLPGEVINYTITLDNSITDTVDYYNVSYAGSDFTAPIVFSGDVNNDAILNIGEIWVYETSYTVIQHDFMVNGIPAESTGIQYNGSISIQGLGGDYTVSWFAGINTLDTDGDGVTDAIENVDGTDPNDGCDFVLGNITVSQTNEWFNADCDGDGISNEMEFFTGGNTHDSDNDGVIDMFDIDDDNDGIITLVEFTHGNTDFDNLPNYLDTDSDNDNIPDNVESQGINDYVAPSGVDSNNDGLDDAYSNLGISYNLIDTDLDSTFDYMDNDSDSDAISDFDEGVLDVDNDGIPNYRDDMDGLDGIEIFACGDTNFSADFNLIEIENLILNGLDPNTYHVTVYDTMTDAINDTNILSNPYNSSANDVFARMVNDINNDVVISVVFLNVNDAIILNPATLNGCLDGNGTTVFNLEDSIPEITDGDGQTDFDFTFHTDLVSAEVGTNILVSPYASTLNSQVVYAKGVNVTTGCIRIVEVTLNAVNCTACNEVSNITYTNLSESGVTVSWTDNNTPQASNWEIELAVSGTTPNGQGTGVYTTYTEFTNLQPSQSYDVYIRVNCGNNVYSNWIMSTFTTLGCNQPSINQSSAGNQDYITISWIDNNTPQATSWEVLYGLMGFDDADGTLVNVTTNTFTLSGIDVQLSYEIRVRSVCTANNVSEWSVITFPTSYVPPVINSPYSVNVIPYQLYTQPLTATTNADDWYTDLYNLDFNFNFFGYDYNQVTVGTNSVISFDVNDAGNFCEWNIDYVLPNTNIIDNAVLGAYQDYYDYTTGTGTMGVGYVGTAPFRKFVVFFDDVALYGSACAGMASANQMIIYESYNFIDVQVKDRNVCNAWNEGNAIIGIQNIGGTEAYFPADRNTGNWEAHNEGYRFKPEYDVLDFQYIICDPEVDGVEVFDLTTVYNHFDDGTGNTISMHLNITDAQNNTNPITTPFTNTSNSQIIFCVITDSVTGDIEVKRVLLAVIDCNADYDLDSVDTSSEDLNGNGNYGDDDTDGDSIPNFIDEDDDGDFVLTTVEAVVTTNKNNSSTTQFIDTDGDQIPNYLDNDDDGDGVLTINEDYDGDNNPTNDDTNNDGIDDYLQSSVALGTNENLINSFMLYPNPVEDVLTIKFNDLQTNVSVEIFNIHGQKVLVRNSVNDSLQIDVSNLTSGMYFVNVNNTNTVVTKKFIKK